MIHPRAAARPTNRLARETSPYLLLHAHNPVDWYPWGPEAFARAKAENKPIFLSVGYSSCYWCHVMERESFVDAEIAKALNAGFVCIKVDREERPDVDQIYMAALQAFGPGGWPMSMFLTPDGRPFFGGTYFRPATARVAGVFDHRQRGGQGLGQAAGRDRKAADAVTEAVRRRLKAASAARKLAALADWAAAGLKQLAEQFDPEYGGFGFNPTTPAGPSFPEPVNLVFLLDQHQRRRRTGSRRPQRNRDPARERETGPLRMVLLTLDRMARGGIRDHLGGGYHRYATDRYWIVPALRENALRQRPARLGAPAGVRDHQRSALAREAEATFAFVERQE